MTCGIPAPCEKTSLSPPRMARTASSAFTVRLESNSFLFICIFQWFVRVVKEDFGGGGNASLFGWADTFPSERGGKATSRPMPFQKSTSRGAFGLRLPQNHDLLFMSKSQGEGERSSYPSASAPFISKVIPRPLSLLGSSRSELANMILNRRRSCRKGQKQQAPGTLTGCARSTRPPGRSRSPLCRCSPIFFPTAIGIPAACCTGGGCA